MIPPLCLHLQALRIQQTGQTGQGRCLTEGVGSERRLVGSERLRVRLQVDERKASQGAPAGMAEVSEEDELQAAEEVSSSHSLGRKRERKFVMKSFFFARSEHDRLENQL